MTKFLITLLLSLAYPCWACQGSVIAFRGLGEVFDNQALKEYAATIGYCDRTYNWNQINQAVTYIDSNTLPYHLYGFSKGAESVARILKRQEIRRPEYAITIGAYKTVDVDFSKYNVKYTNYFDASGIGQTSPGIFLNVSHDRIQREVNRILIWGQ